MTPAGARCSRRISSKGRWSMTSNWLGLEREARAGLGVGRHRRGAGRDARVTIGASLLLDGTRLARGEDDLGVGQPEREQRDEPDEVVVIDCRHLGAAAGDLPQARRRRGTLPCRASSRCCGRAVPSAVISKARSGLRPTRMPGIGDAHAGAVGAIEVGQPALEVGARVLGVGPHELARRSADRRFPGRCTSSASAATVPSACAAMPSSSAANSCVVDRADVDQHVVEAEALRSRSAALT